MKDRLHVQTVLDEIPNILFSYYGEYDVQRKYGVCKKPVDTLDLWFSGVKEVVLKNSDFVPIYNHEPNNTLSLHERIF